MDNEILFAEKQKFKQWWLWLILLGVNGLVLFGLYSQFLEGKQFGDKSMSNEELLFAAGLTILMTILFSSFQLETKIMKDGIYVKFFPFHLSYRHFTWDKISKSFVRQYSPISEYGGWGFRFGFFGNGRAFNVSGNKGLQLVFSDNKKLLIGTNKPEELKEVLSKIGQLNP